MNDLTGYSDSELKSIHNYLTKEKNAFIAVKKKTPTIPEELALEITMKEYQKDFEKLVKETIDKV